MINTIKQILEDKKLEYLLKEAKTTSYELFFVNNELQMNRAKDTTNYLLTVYDNHDKYKGSSSFEIYPSMNKEEITNKIEEGLQAAKLVDNPYYELAKPTQITEFDQITNLNSYNSKELAVKISESILGIKKDINSLLNATEIFINDVEVRLINSNGVDLNKKIRYDEVEFISTYNGEKESVEIYSFLELGNLDLDYIKSIVNQKLEEARLRSLASSMPSFESIDVLFRSEEIKELMTYYLGQTNYSSIYNKTSTCKIGDKFQNNIIGDPINLTLDPFMSSSIDSSGFDSRGYKNEKLDIIKNGEVINLWGDRVYAQYLNCISKSNTGNFILGNGSLNINKLDRYLEIVSMSGIQVDDVTGSFGGEIRLALLHEKEKITPLFGGSISGFLKDYQDSLLLSKETVEENFYNGPKYLLIKNANILGR